MAGTSDFFLNFGSNAKTFASGLSGELKPATESITSLTTALERYDAVTANRKTNGPLDNLFTRLDSVSQKFADLTGSLASTFDKAIQGMNLLREDMANLLQSVQGVNNATKRGPGRPALTTVDENDAQSAAKVRNAQTLKANLDSSNRQLERLAELNETLAGRLNNAGDKTIILGRAVDGLRTASDKAVLGIDVLESRLSRLGEGVVINAPTGGVAGGGGMAAAEMPVLMASFAEALRGITLQVGEANIQTARVVSQVETAAKATTAEALETQRYTTTERSEMQGPQINKRVVEGSNRALPVLEGSMWDQPAKAGTYAVGQRAIPFRNADLIAGETFNQHFARMGALQNRFDAVQRQLPTAATLDPLHGPLMEKISTAFFKGGGIHADAVTRGERLGNSAAYSIQESVRANPGQRFLAGAQDEKMLEEGRAAGLGTNIQQIVERSLQFTHQRRVGVDTLPGELPSARAEHLENFIAQELKNNPLQTFGGLGNRELNAVRKQIDSHILRAGGYTEERGEGFEGVYHPPQGELPVYLRDHPDPQALYQGALRRQAKDEEGREFSAGYSAMSQGRREQQRATDLFRDTGREHDTSLGSQTGYRATSREVLERQYALTTQLSAAKERLAAAQEFHETSVYQHDQLLGVGSGASKEEVDAAKLRRASSADAVQIAKEKVDLAKKDLDAEKATVASRQQSAKEGIRRYDEISVNTRAARALGRALPQDLSDQIAPAPVEAVLPSRQRAAEIRRRRTEAERLLTSLNKDPEGFVARSQTTIEDERAKEHERAVEEQRIKQSTINERLAAATAAVPATAADRLDLQRKIESAAPTAAKRMAREAAAAQAQLAQVLEERRSGVPLVEREVSLPTETRFSNISPGRARRYLNDEIEGYTNELEGTGRRQFGTRQTAESRAAEILPRLTAFGIPADQAATLSRGTNDEIRAALLEAAAKMDEAAVKQQQAADKAEANQNRDEGSSTGTSGRKKGKKNRQADDEGTQANVTGELDATRVERDQLAARHDDVLARKRGANAALKQANAIGAGTPELTAASEAANAELTELNTRLHALNSQIRGMERKIEQATAATGGGGGRPPRPPKTTGGAAPDEEPPSDGNKRRIPADDPLLQAKMQERLQTFSSDTRAAVEQARLAAGITSETKSLSDAQKAHVLSAAQQFRDDPAYSSMYADTSRRTFAAGLGLPRSAANNRFMNDTFKRGGILDDPARDVGVHTNTTAAIARMTQVEEALAIESRKVREALLGQIAAEERLAAVRGNPASTPGQIARAERGVSSATRGYETAMLAEENPALGGFGKLLQHGGQQAIRFASFQIAFTGIEKVRELVDTGIQAQTQFVRLQSNLEATGKSATGLMQALGDISSQTAQPLAHTIQAASELTGVLKTRGDLLEGTKIASELANISHGMLTATQAAIGLRDVTDAYGLHGVAALRGVGDMIAKVSQVTGVSVHDVIEGTTQLAQEAHSFGLNQRQAAVLAAEVTKNTGESGSAAAEQVSRILSTFNNTKVQQLLAKTVVPDLAQDGVTRNKDAGKTVVPAELFNQPGGVGQGLTQLLQMYDQLAPAQQHAIDALVGTGRQARALTGLLRDSATAGQLLNSTLDDQGALATQNQRFLQTLGGAVQKLGADFRNLGADLMQAHVFDILALIIGAVDTLITTVDALFRVFDKFNDNPVTKNLLQMLILLGEVSLAFKVFGGEKAAAFGMSIASRVGLGGFFGNVGARRAEQAEAAAASGGATFIPFARARAMGTVLSDTVMSRPGVPYVRPGITALSPEQALGNPFTGQLAAPPGTPGTMIIGGSTSAAVGARALTAEQALGNPFTGQMAAQAEIATTKLGGLGSGIVGLGKSVAGPLIAISALMALFNEFGKQGAADKATRQHSISLEDEITGKSAEERKRKSEETNQDQIQDLEAKAATRRERIRPRSGVGGYFRDLVDIPKTVERYRDTVTGDMSGGYTSNEFETKNANNYLKYTRDLDVAEKTGDPKKIAAAQKAVDKAIADGAEKLVKTAGDRDARDRAWSMLYQVKSQLDADAASRIQTLMGISQIDQLTLQQLENMQTFIGKTSSMNSRTLRMDPSGLQDALDDTGANPNSTIGRIGKKIIGGEGALARARDTVQLDKLELPQLDVQINSPSRGLGDPDRERLVKTRDAVIANLQQQMDLVDQLTIQNDEAFAGILQKIGNLPGATQQLKAETTAITGALSAIGDATDPTYLTYLGTLADKNQQKADLAVQPGIDAANLDSARNPNRVSQSKDAQTVAQLRLDAARAAAQETRQDLIDQQDKAQKKLADAQGRVAWWDQSGNTEGPARQTLLDNVTTASTELTAATNLVGADKTEKAAAVQAALASKAQADLAVKQSLEDQVTSALALKAAYLQASGAGVIAVDAINVQKANADVAFATKTYGAGSTEANNAQIAAIQAGMTQKQDTHEQATSAIALRAALQENSGNEVGAARTNLTKINSDLAFAVATYGRDSKEANAARAAAIAGNATLQQKIDDALNASLDLEISMLSNRGNDSDKRRILADKVKETQNNLNAFIARGGDKNSTEGKKLAAQRNDARRSSVDQGAQIQIDTLDYMHEMFQISTTQEIAALKNILKNKQLTQDRVRSIMLQIKNLQNEMQGQFNLGDIKLPTVYDVRRMMASGQASAAAASSTIGYQDNKQVNINIYGGNTAQVQQVVSAQLGTSATGRLAVSPKKV